VLKLDDPVSMKRLGGRTRSTRVSLSPSKIPYVGFSPVRLQTEIPRRPSAKDGATRPLLYTPRQNRVAITYGPYGQAGGGGSPVPSVQRPLARQQVLLSRRVAAYYGLISASHHLPATYVFVDGSLLRADNERVPNLLRVSVLVVPPSAPRRPERLHSAVASPLTLAFVLFARTRHPHVRAFRFWRGCVTRLQSSLHAAARRIASLAPAKTFTFELSPPESPQ
jgi:hypothetical protein